MPAWDVISTLDSPTSGAFTFTGLSLSGYSILQVRGYGITVTTDGTDVRVTFYTASAEVVTNYDWEVQGCASDATNKNDGATSQASGLLVSNDANWDTGNAAGESMGFWLNVDQPGSTALHKRGHCQTWTTEPTGTVVYYSGQLQLQNTGAIDGVKVGGTSNLVAGKVRLLGLA